MTDKLELELEDALRELLMKVAQEVDRQYRGQSQPMTLEAIVDRVLESKDE